MSRKVRLVWLGRDGTIEYPSCRIDEEVGTVSYRDGTYNVLPEAMKREQRALRDVRWMVVTEGSSQPLTAIEDGRGKFPLLDPVLYQGALYTKRAREILLPSSMRDLLIVLVNVMTMAIVLFSVFG